MYLGYGLIERVAVVSTEDTDLLLAICISLVAWERQPWSRKH